MMKKIIELLPWDTECFGYNVAKISTTHLTNEDLAVILQELKEQKIRLAYLFIDAEDNISYNTAKMHGLHPVDKKVKYFMKISSHKNADPINENITSFL